MHIAFVHNIFRSDFFSKAIVRRDLHKSARTRHDHHSVQATSCFARRDAAKVLAKETGVWEHQGLRQAHEVEEG